MFPQSVCLNEVMPKNCGKISLEDLISLKRSERPNEEFWEEFERELLLKQRLLLQKRPVGKVFFATNLWANAKRVCAYGCAAATGGAFLFAGFIGFKAMQTANNETVPTFEVTPTFAVKAIKPDVAPSSLVENVRSEKTNDISGQDFASAPPKQSNPNSTNSKQIVEKKSTLELIDFNAEAFALSKPLEGLDIEEVVTFSKASSASSPLQRELRDKYLEPVGYLATATESQFQSSSTNIQRVSSLRMDGQLFSSNDNRGPRLSEFTLRF